MAASQPHQSLTVAVVGRHGGLRAALAVVAVVERRAAVGELLPLTLHCFPPPAGISAEAAESPWM